MLESYMITITLSGCSASSDKDLYRVIAVIHPCKLQGDAGAGV